MKLLVFAHTPPPHHGQSYMVKLMLDGLGGDVRHRPATSPRAASPAIECYHVNARFSEDMEDIGTFRMGKALLVFRYCVEAIWCRFRHGVRAFYYVPAPGKRAALYRDWMVMILCRPFFRDFIYHWHASGLGDWLRREGTAWERWLTHWLLGRPALGIALGIPNMRDALWFQTRRVELVANGIPDPCPDFLSRVLPRRQARLAGRRRLLAGQPLSAEERSAAGGDPEVFRVLYLAHCTASKGLFDAVEGVLLANAQLAAGSAPVRLHLTVAGAFLEPAEEARFAELRDGSAAITYAGFVGGETKLQLIVESDCLCFPTFYPAEAQPVSVLEAMAAGLACVVTRWRGIPDMLPPDFRGFVSPCAPAEIARVFREIMLEDYALPLREHFQKNYTLQAYLGHLSAALQESSAPISAPA